MAIGPAPIGINAGRHFGWRTRPGVHVRVGDISADINPLADLGTPAVGANEILLHDVKMQWTAPVGHAIAEDYSMLEILAITPSPIQFGYSVSHGIKVKRAAVSIYYTYQHGVCQ